MCICVFLKYSAEISFYWRPDWYAWYFPGNDHSKKSIPHESKLKILTRMFFVTFRCDIYPWRSRSVELLPHSKRWQYTLQNIIHDEIH